MVALLNIYLYLVSIIILNNAASNTRERYSMNFNWSFHLGSQNLEHQTCDATAFKKTSNRQCEEFIDMYNVPKNDINACANACCANPTCAYFQMSSSGLCSLGNIISVYNAFSWSNTCKSSNGNDFYSRLGMTPIPDTNPSHFSPASKSFDDSLWPKISIPHDFVVAGTFTPNPPDKEPRTGSHGYLPKNTSWYRKHFSLPQEYQNNTTLWITFDGIYRNSIVFINGKFKGNHSSGYTSFRYYLDPTTDALEFGDNSNNVLSIFVDATAEE
eukprot:84280_1